MSRPALAVLTEYLRDSRVLLILDNCEHLIRSCAELADTLLRTCPRLCILATSREALRIPGEIVWRVPSLTTPNPAALLPPDLLLDFEAIQLFIDHVMAAQPDFALTPHSLQVIAHICSRLDGIPLAIEMAAAQTVALSVDEIAAGLHDCFALLTSGSRIALPRHQTLQVALDWSYNLLTAPEQVLLARLSVFTGGWTAAAARAVVGDESSDHTGAGEAQGLPASSVLPLLIGLVQRSLVVTTHQESQTRYHFLEAIGQYAERKLSQCGAANALRDRHLAYYLALAEDNSPPMRLHSVRHQRLDSEHSNLRSAFAWAKAHATTDKGERLLRLSGALRDWFITRSLYREGQAWVEEALKLGADGPPSARAWALVTKASLLLWLGDYRQSTTLFQESLILFEQVNDRYGIAAASLNLADIAMQAAPDAEQVTRLAQRALDLFRQIERPHGVINALGILGYVTFYQGDVAQARSYTEQSMRVSDEIGDVTGVAAGLYFLHVIDPRGACALWEQRVAQERQSGDRERLATMLAGYGAVQMREADYEQAKVLLRECLELRQKLSGHYAHGDAFVDVAKLLGMAEQQVGDTAEALIHFNQCIAVSRQSGNTYQTGMAQLMRASLLIGQGEFTQSARDLRECVRQYQAHGNVFELAITITQMAELARGEGHLERFARLAAAAARLEDQIADQERNPFASYELSIMLNIYYRPALPAARARLDDPVLDTAWAEGQQMTLEQAVAYALQGGEVDEPPVRDLLRRY